jgi:hypothetical protein
MFAHIIHTNPIHYNCNPLPWSTAPPPTATSQREREEYSIQESDDRIKKARCSKPLCARQLLDDHDHDCVPNRIEFRCELLGKLFSSLLHQSVEIKCWKTRQMKTMSYQSFGTKPVGTHHPYQSNTNTPHAQSVTLTYSNSTACISTQD